MSESFTHYFFVKVGFGNDFLEKTVEKAKNDPESKAFFWMGYNDVPIPQLSGEVFLKYPARNYNDLYYLTMMSTVSRYREHTRLITYTNECMQIWRMTGPVHDLPSEEFLAHKEICGANNPEYKEAGNKSLPVALEMEVFRDQIPACIDSLRVHSYLNRGTFRYLYSTNGGLIGEETVKSDKLKNHFLCREEVSLPLVKKEPEVKYHETYFACFTRKYFDWLRNGKLRKSFQEEYQLNDSDLYELVFLMMSPAQLETAAMMFALSLGLLPDVGIGKALDVIDVRASLRYKGNWEQDVNEMINVIQQIMGCQLSSKIKDKLLDNGTLLFQCKDYSAKQDLPEHVLRFMPWTEKQDGKTITLSQIKNYLSLDDTEKRLLQFRNWLQLLVFYYKKSKDELRINDRY